MRKYLISPPKGRKKYSINAMNYFLGATAIQATEPKQWVLKHSYPLVNVAKWFVGPEKYLRKPCMNAMTA